MFFYFLFIVYFFSEWHFLIIQITGDIKAARDALVEVTTRLRSYLYRDFFQKDTPPSSISAAGPVGSASGMEAVSPNNITPVREGQTGSETPAATNLNVQTAATTQSLKVLTGGSGAIFVLILASLHCSFVYFFFYCFLFNGYSKFNCFTVEK